MLHNLELEWFFCKKIRKVIRDTLIGKLLTSENGFNFVLIMVDVVTRFVVLKPLQTKRVVQMAMNDRVLSRHGSRPFSVMFGRKMNGFDDYREVSWEEKLAENYNCVIALGSRGLGLDWETSDV